MTNRKEKGSMGESRPEPILAEEILKQLPLFYRFLKCLPLNEMAEMDEYLTAPCDRLQSPARRIARGYKPISIYEHNEEPVQAIRGSDPGMG